MRITDKDGNVVVVTGIRAGLVGGARMRAYSGNLQDPPIEEDAVRQVLRGDASEELPRMVATASPAFTISFLVQMFMIWRNALP